MTSTATETSIHTHTHAHTVAEYGTLMIVDSEENFRKEEMDKLEKDVKELGLSVLVLAEW
jgi:hypothetical protein